MKQEIRQISCRVALQTRNRPFWRYDQWVSALGGNRGLSPVILPVIHYYFLSGKRHHEWGTEMIKGTDEQERRGFCE